MRLTLRTLLAYIDRVLTPADHEELHRRIQQNEVIGRLTHRIERLTGQSEMLSPRLTAPGLAGDPNAIAEYLDDVLPGGSVPEFERICLASDEQLAELAHCHQLLATAIRTPVTVPESLRARAIELADPARRAEIEHQLLTRTARRKRVGGVQVVPAAAEEDGESSQATDQHVDAASPVPAPMVASGGGSIRPEGLDLEDSKLAREVPEYLIGSTSSGMWRMPLAIAVVSIVLCGMLWQALGPWETVRSLLVAQREPSSIFDDDPPLRVRELAPAEPGEAMFDELIVSEEEPPLIGNVPNSGDAGGEGARPSAADDAATAISESEAVPPLPTEAIANADDPEIETSDAAPPLPAGVSEIKDSSPNPSPALAEGATAVPSLTGPLAMWSPQDDSQRASVILLRTPEGWRLAQPQVPTAATEWIVPPYTRTQLALAGQVEWIACGPSYLSFDEQQDVTQVGTSLCRAFVRSPEQRTLQLQTPVGEYLIRPASAGVELAIEVGYRPATAGSILNPGVMRAVFVATVTNGAATIDEVTLEGGTVATKLNVGETFGAVEGERSSRFVMRSIPDWYRSSTSRASDKLAVQDVAKVLAPALDKQTTVGGEIANLVDSRRAETAALAVQMSLLTGAWEPFVSRFLNDIRFRNYWTPAIELTRQVVMADGKNAETLRQSLIAMHGSEQGELAYELFVGPSTGLASDAQNSTANGPLAGLVAQLENPNLTIRVLASYQLEKLTGQTFAYQPHAPSKASVQQWRRELATNRVSLQPIGEILNEKVAKTTP